MARYYRDFLETRTLFEEQSARHREKLDGVMAEQTLCYLMTWVERPAEVRIVLRGPDPPTGIRSRAALRQHEFRLPQLPNDLLRLVPPPSQPISPS